jgi:Cu/Ag efflux pump CusA
VVIGGLISSTVLTLVILPLLYRRFCIAKDGRKA